MSKRGKGPEPSGENDPLLQWNKRKQENYVDYTQTLKGVTPALLPQRRPIFANASMVAMSNNTILINSSSLPSPPKGIKKSYSIHADGSVSYLTPLQMGRHELYEAIPFAAVFGLQRKERNLRTAYATYAADLDVMELASSKKDLTVEEIENRHSFANLVIMDELQLDSVMVTTPLIFAVLAAVISQFLVGYNTGVMNAPESVIPHNSTFVWSLAVAAFAVGGPFGANLAGILADTRGRRGALMINTWTFILGGILQTSSINMPMIISSRFIIGFASGFSSVLVPIYLGELAPPTMRGALGTLTQFALVIGILVSDLLAFIFATESKWRFLFSTTPLIAIIQLFCAPWILESPRWLLSKDPSSRKARYILKKLRGLRDDNEVEIEVNHFADAMKAQPIGTTSAEEGSDIGFISMCKNKNIRLLVISCVVLQMSQQLCGINAVFYYSSSLFEGVIANPLVGTSLVGGVNVVATYVALLLMDSFGRRTLILWSAGGMFASCVVLVLSLLHYFSNTTALISVIAYVSFFEIGLGPIPWLIVAEMFDAKYVAIAMSASCQLNWACNFIVGIAFPLLNECLHEYTFVPFAIVLLMTFLFALIWLPETQGTTPEELQAELVEKNSSTVYHNISINADSINEPIGKAWKKAIDQVRKEEEEAMQAGTFNYGFEPIPNQGGLSNSSAGANKATDWQANIAGPGAIVSDT